MVLHTLEMIFLVLLFIVVMSCNSEMLPFNVKCVPHCVIRKSLPAATRCFCKSFAVTQGFLFSCHLSDLVAVVANFLSQSGRVATVPLMMTINAASINYWSHLIV